MKSIVGSLLPLFGLGLLAACGSSEPTPAAGAKLEPRVAADTATPRIASAECEREERCKNIGASLKFSSVEHCMKVKSETISKDFSEDKDCHNGILAKDLDACVRKTTDQTCEGLSSVISNVERSAACGSNELCMD